jgi:hypothetical protein
MIREVLFDTNPWLLGLQHFNHFLLSSFCDLASQESPSLSHCFTRSLISLPSRTISRFVGLLTLLTLCLRFYTHLCSQFWRKKKSMAGTSVQSLGVNCFFQTVIFLYLMDNDTSWMILFSSGIGK